MLLHMGLISSTCLNHLNVLAELLPSPKESHMHSFLHTLKAKLIAIKQALATDTHNIQFNTNQMDEDLSSDTHTHTHTLSL